MTDVVMTLVNQNAQPTERHSLVADLNAFFSGQIVQLQKENTALVERVSDLE